MTDVDFVSVEVEKILTKLGLPSDGLIRVYDINGTKFRANYYHEHKLLWTRCVLLKDRAVTVSPIQ